MDAYESNAAVSSRQRMNGEAMQCTIAAKPDAITLVMLTYVQACCFGWETVPATAKAQVYSSACNSYTRISEPVYGCEYHLPV